MKDATVMSQPVPDLALLRASDKPAVTLPWPGKPVRRLSFQRRKGLFVKGPIDWKWMAAAGKTKGKGLQVAIVLCLLAGMKPTGPVMLASARLKDIGVDRHSARRGLIRLQEAGLVLVERSRGRAPRVTLCAIP